MTLILLFKPSTKPLLKRKTKSFAISLKKWRNVLINGAKHLSEERSTDFIPLLRRRTPLALETLSLKIAVNWFE